MTQTTPPAPPWEPPIAGTEAEQLFGALDRLRTTFRWKADGLDAAGLDLHLSGAPSPAVWRPHGPEVPDWRPVSGTWEW
ncbi:MAG: hypothetical protein KQH57_04545 [Actinomycetales bacterium]|nr:hypothetical protein [Actinomycetales bacterium]